MIFRRKCCLRIAHGWRHVSCDRCWSVLYKRIYLILPFEPNCFQYIWAWSYKSKNDQLDSWVEKDVERFSRLCQPLSMQTPAANYLAILDEAEYNMKIFDFYKQSQLFIILILNMFRWIVFSIITKYSGLKNVNCSKQIKKKQNHTWNLAVAFTKLLWW